MEFKGTEGKWEIMMDGDEIKIIQADSLENGAGWRSYIAICEEVQCIEDANLIAQHLTFSKHFSYYLSKLKREQRQHIQNGMDLLIKVSQQSSRLWEVSNVRVLRSRYQTPRNGK